MNKEIADLTQEMTKQIGASEMTLVDRLKKILNAPRPRGGFACRMIEESQLTEIIQTLERQEKEIKKLNNRGLEPIELNVEEYERLSRQAAIKRYVQEIARKDKLLAEAKEYLDKMGGYYDLDGFVRYPEIGEWLAALEEEGKK